MSITEPMLIHKEDYPDWIKKNGGILVYATDKAIEVSVAHVNFFKLLMAADANGFKLLGSTLNPNRTTRLVFTKEKPHGIKSEPRVKDNKKSEPAEYAKPQTRRGSRSKSDGSKSTEDNDANDEKGKSKGKKKGKKKEDSDPEDPNPEDPGNGE